MVGAALNVATVRHANDDRAIPLAIGAIVEAGEFIEELVHPRPGIVGKLNFSNGLMIAIERKAESKGDNGRFGKRSIETAILTKTSREGASNAEYAPFSMSYVLSKYNNTSIALHFFH